MHACSASTATNANEQIINFQSLETSTIIISIHSPIPETRLLADVELFLAKGIYPRTIDRH